MFTGLIFMSGVTSAADTVRIGAIWGLSGPGSQLQAILRDGAVLATEWINGKGGITVAGRQYMVELLIEDNKNTAVGATSVATKLVHRDKVKFITGMQVAFQIEAVQSVTEPNKVLLAVTKCTTLDPRNRYTFAANWGYTAPVPGLYDFLLKAYPGVKTVGFTAHDEPSALATLKVAREVAKSHGLKLFDPVMTQFAAKEYYPTWTKLLEDKPDAVDIGVGFPDGISASVRQGRELGFKGPIITTSQAGPATYVKLIGQEAATDFVFAAFDPLAPGAPPMIRKIVKIWEAKFRQPFDLSGLVGWNSVWALVQAIEKAQSFDVNQIVKTWEAMKSIETPWGMGTMGGQKAFGINHMVLAPAAISRIQAGKVDLTRWYKPDL
jgi:branched-chain amino acid transport system substrate-binding protein